MYRLGVSLILERVSWLKRESIVHREFPPPHIQVGERHLPRLTNMCHELRRPHRSFKGKRLLGDVILLQ
jgi:hypothetical protein